MERWFPRLAVPMTWEQFRQLPQHAAFRYEYLDGVAKLTSRPRRYHALLSFPDAPPLPRPNAATVRSLQADDWQRLPSVFAAAFAGSPPFSLLTPEQRLAAAEDCLERTQAGEFGATIEPASFIAFVEDRIAAAIIITLLQAGDLERFDDPRWGERPPLDPLSQRWGRPHVTWVLTDPRHARQGLASALLDRSVAALTDLGYHELASTFLLGNEPSALWHWRNGFRLLRYVGSGRRVEG